MVLFFLSLHRIGKIVFSDENRAKKKFYFPEVPKKFWVGG